MGHNITFQKTGNPKTARADAVSCSSESYDKKYRMCHFWAILPFIYDLFRQSRSNPMSHRLWPIFISTSSSIYDLFLDKSLG